MIFDTLEHLEQYSGLQAEVVQGLDFLANADFSILADGRHELNGNDFFYMLMSYDSQVDSENPEAHKNYIDIQYIVSGTEEMGYAPLSFMDGVREAKPDNDVWFFHGATQHLVMKAGQFAIFYPGDVHAPSMAVGGVSSPVRKCVVKIRMN